MSRPAWPARPKGCPNGRERLGSALGDGHLARSETARPAASRHHAMLLAPGIRPDRLPPPTAPGEGSKDRNPCISYGPAIYRRH